MRLSLNDIFFSEILFWGFRMISFDNNDNFVLLFPQGYRLGEAQNADNFSGCQVPDSIRRVRAIYIGAAKCFISLHKNKS